MSGRFRTTVEPRDVEGINEIGWHVDRWLDYRIVSCRWDWDLLHAWDKATTSLFDYLSEPKS